MEVDDVEACCYAFLLHKYDIAEADICALLDGNHSQGTGHK